VVISDRNFFRCGGGAVGLAVSAAILQAVLKANLPPNYRYLAHSTYAIPARSSVSAADWELIVNAYMKGSHAVFILQLPLVGMCLLGCIFVRDRGLERPKEKDEEVVQNKTESKDEEAEAVDSEATANHDQNSEEKIDVGQAHLGTESETATEGAISTTDHENESHEEKEKELKNEKGK
jgi:hypothetical protein